MAATVFPPRQAAPRDLEPCSPAPHHLPSRLFGCYHVHSMPRNPLPLHGTLNVPATRRGRRFPEPWPHTRTQRLCMPSGENLASAALQEANKTLAGRGHSQCICDAPYASWTGRPLTASRHDRYPVLRLEHGIGGRSVIQVQSRART